MDKDFWRSFLLFLDEATMPEIQDRLAKTRNMVDAGLENPDVRADAKRIIRFLEEELVSRSMNGH